MSRPTAPAPPLAGTTVIVTRPAGTARGLLAAARARGARALALPGLSLRRTRAAEAARQRLRAARGADGWIFTSPAAVRFAFRLLPTLKPARAALVFAPGGGSAGALARRGVRALAPESRSDSEGLLARPELAEPRGRRFVLVGAAGGRGLIAPALRARGAEVEEIHVYERAPPRLTRRHVAGLAEAADPLIVLASSAEALANLAAALPPDALRRLRAQPLVVSSARLAAAAAAHGFARVTTAASARPRDLLAAAERAVASA